MTSTEPSTSVLTQFVQRARRLYTLPAVAMKVIELTGHPQVDVRKLKECIENDPALTAKILRVVNSSLFGLSREITDLNQALALLGVKPLKLLVLGFSLPAELFDGLEAGVLERYWRHTLTKAVASREIAESIWSISGDEPFISGLLQGIGMLALIQDLGEHYLVFLDGVQRQGGNLCALETKALGFDHAILSARLLDHWGLPDSVSQAVGRPHDVERLAALDPAEADIPQILHLAELCTVLLTQQRPGALRELLDAGQRYRGLTEDQLQRLVASLDEKVRQLADVLALQLPGDLNYQQVLAEAHAQAAEVAEQWITDVEQEQTLLHEVESLGALALRVAAQDTSMSAAAIKSSSSSTDAKRESARGEPAQDLQNAALDSLSESPPPASAVGADAPTDPALVGRVSQAVAACRQARCELTLLITQLDRYDELIMTRGLVGAEQLARLLEAAVASLWDGDGVHLAQGDGRFALLLENCDRRTAVELARRMVHGIREWSQRRGQQNTHVTVSAGLATLNLPPKNFPSHELIEAAQRCLYGAQISGGDVVKSIDIY
ncbi:MAG: HDOD domain-containing protein [Pirellulaceae bacterium]